MIGESDYLGKGFGTETVQVLVEYAFAHLNMNKVHLTALADNQRAVASYRKVGFVKEGLFKDHVWSNGSWHDVVFMAIFRNDN